MNDSYMEYRPDAASARVGGRLAPATAGIVQRLAKTYFPEGMVKSEGASSYWKEFYRHFTVELGPTGEIVRLENFGFGASHNQSLKWRILTTAFVEAHLAILRMPGLREGVVSGRKTVARQGLAFSQDSFRQVATVVLCAPHIRAVKVEPGERRTFVVIGDGPGTLSALLHESFPEARIHLIDLGPTSLFQAVYLGRAFPDVRHSLAGDADAAEATFVYAPSEIRDRLPAGVVHFAANVASMEEMSPETVAAYFDYLRARNTQLFYCCNRVEKLLPGGEVSRILDYPWDSSDQYLVDADCPWHQWFIGKAHSPRYRVMGIPIPYIHVYDGPHWHRLAKLSPGA